MKNNLGILAVIAVVFALGGCSSDDTSDSGGTNTTVDLSLLGPENEATGTPIKVGLVVDGASDAMDSSSVMTAGEATAEYANQHLAGINGHPIEIEACETGHTPAGATTCAVQMINAEVDAVVMPLSGQDGAIVTGLKDSGIPTIAYTTANPAIVADPAAFVLGNPFAAIAAPAAIANEREIEKVALVVIDVPATTGPIKALATPIFEEAGVEFEMINVSPQVADMTPQIQQAMNNGNEMLLIGGPEQFIISALKAIQQLGFEGDVMLAGAASATAVAEAVPGALEGVTVVSPMTDDADDPDVQLYDAVMAKYADDVEQNAATPQGFVAMLGLVRALSGNPEAVDPASITAAIGSMPEPVDLPRGAGITYQCGSKPLQFAPSVCSADILAGTLDANGEGHDFETVDVAPYLPGG